MEAIVKHDPTSSSLLELRLGGGEAVLAEAGAMVARDGGVALEVALDAGGAPGLGARLRALLVAVLRKLIGGEHVFVNRFVAPAAGGWVWVAPAAAGEIRRLPLREGDRWTLVPGAFVAAGPGLRVRARWAGLGALLSRDAAFWVDVEGEGEVWVAAQGAAIAIEVDGASIVDAGHLVAYAAPLRARVRGHRGAAPWRVRGEGTVVELSGRGPALVQSRSTRALVAHLEPLLPE